MLPHFDVCQSGKIIGLKLLNYIGEECKSLNEDKRKDNLSLRERVKDLF